MHTADKLMNTRLLEYACFQVLCQAILVAHYSVFAGSQLRRAADVEEPNSPADVDR